MRPCKRQQKFLVLGRPPDQGQTSGPNPPLSPFLARPENCGSVAGVCADVAMDFDITEITEAPPTPSRHYSHLWLISKCRDLVGPFLQVRMP